MWSIVTLVNGKLKIVYMTDECVVLKEGANNESNWRGDALPILDGSGTVTGNVYPKLCKKS